VKTVVTKGEYAVRKNRSPACITKWISEKKISAAALVGDGHRARIWVEQADYDLAMRLDPSQQSAQPNPVGGSAGPPIAPSAEQQSPPLLKRPANDDDEDLRRRRRADADKAEHDAEAARRRNAVDEGRWILADDAMRAWGKELSRLVADTETFLYQTVARDLAEKHGLDWKTVSAELRALYRKYRATTSEDAKARHDARTADLAIAAE
jgi:hypothetical protein